MSIDTLLPAYLVLLAVAGFMWVVMNRSTSASATTLSRRRTNRPGWIACRRARGGIGHKRDRVGVGWTSATRSVHLSHRELAGHGFVAGGPGSGKTTFLQLLVEASAGRIPVVLVDPKGSPALEATVRAHGGQVWTLDGHLPADLLDPRPWQVPELLLEGEDYSADARAYRDAAHQRALWAAWALALRHEPMDLARLRGMLDRTALLTALEPFRGDPRVDEWYQRLEHQHGGLEDSGARGLDRSLGTLLDGVAIRGSLRTCPEALRLDDVMATNGLVLFSLDAAAYPAATRKVASWILLGMGRRARQLGGGASTTTGSSTPRALLLVDEVGALGSSARHLRGLVGRARESGLAVVLATQGPSDLEAVDRALLPQVLQDTAWQLVFRQGSPHDARQVEALFGQAWTHDRTWFSDGRVAWREVERPRVSVDEWMNALEPGDAWLRVAPIDKGWRQERIRVALPRPPVFGQPVRSTISVNGSVTMFDSDRRALTGGVSGRAVASDGGTNVPTPLRPLALPPVPPYCPADLVERMGADIIAKCERRWPRRHHELGPCLVWVGAKGPDTEKGPYGRMYDPAIAKSDYVHRVVWRRCFGVIPDGLEVDELCEVALCVRPDQCVRPDHLAVKTKSANVKRRGPTRGPNRRADGRSVTLDQLVELLTRFEVLDDKRRGRCWSPALYATGARSRGNAGVAAVSALVFDLDRVPPNPTRLASVCWIGHTTWSHRADAPRWRVIIPLANVVAATSWQDMWQRARAALCPEADPACKDPSRAYWVPSHPLGVAPETRWHPGELLDARVLPELPPERPQVRPAPPVSARRDRRRRGDAYMATVLANLEAAAPGGRNVALNQAAWTLGHWVAAGALDQRVVEDALYAAAERNGLVADNGQRQCWATIRSGLSAGLQS